MSNGSSSENAGIPIQADGLCFSESAKLFKYIYIIIHNKQLLFISAVSAADSLDLFKYKGKHKEEQETKSHLCYISVCSM